VPVTAYSLDLGKEHTDLLDAKLQRKMMTPGPAGKIAASDVDLLAVIAMAGVAAEGMSYEQVTGQNADLFLLQKILNKSQDKLPAAQQQTVTRWAVRDMRERERERARSGVTVIGLYDLTSQSYSAWPRDDPPPGSIRLPYPSARRLVGPS
jgi:hypothetical protein